ncbi:MAG: metallophosphoesterase [Clostridiales bacterium]|nr:metallophosphoesterase [Clostridiales bacterium]
MSDTQADPLTGDYGAFGALLTRAVADRRPELLLLGGDTVNDGADEDEWRAFWDAAGMALDGLAVAAAAGNHDNKALLANQFTLPDAAPERPGEGWFYSFDMKGVHFVILDSNIMGAANEADIAWLEADLSGEAAAAADWRIAVCHHPFLTVINSPKDEARAQTMRDSFLPLLVEYGVDLLLTGHQHNYARSLPMNAGGDAAIRSDTVDAGSLGSAFVQLMAASGGKASYTHDDRPYLARTAEAPNYLALLAEGDSLSVTAYSADGGVIDSFTLIAAAP